VFLRFFHARSKHSLVASGRLFSSLHLDYRQETGMRRSSESLCLIALLLNSAVTQTQQVNMTPPDDPRQFLDVAAKINGLTSANLGPWHIKATFQFLDERGSVRESGTYEAFWKSPIKFKMIYTSPSYSRTVWANESGNYATTDPRWPGEIEWNVRRSLFDVVPEPARFPNYDLHWREVTLGIKVKCIDATSIYISLAPQDMPFYCFDPGAPVIRFSSESLQLYQATFNNFLFRNGTYIAKDVELSHARRPYFRLHVDTLEPLVESIDQIFQPDSGTLTVQRRIVIDSDLRDVHATAKSGIPHGKEVVVQVLVNKKGKVVDARASGGDGIRQFHSLAAARTWEFKPYVVQGAPIEFYTELEFF
jgi:hypothetical protein